MEPDVAVLEGEEPERGALGGGTGKGGARGTKSEIAAQEGEEAGSNGCGAGGERLERSRSAEGLHRHPTPHRERRGDAQIPPVTEPRP